MGVRTGAVEGVEMSPVAPFQGVYKGSRVFVTGHTGFKGAWLAIWLRMLGTEVYGYALEPPTEPSLFELAGVEDLINAHKIADVVDAGTLSSAMRDAEAEFVFHLAAQPLVRASYDDPRGTYETNVMGTVNVLEAVRATPSVRAVVVVTSDKCYENHEWEYAYRENDAMGGHDPYSSSKGCSELVCSAYRQSFLSHSGAPGLASARAGNVIGGGDWAVDRIVPDCVRALSQGESIEVRNPGAVRPWQHVLESLSGYLWLASRLAEDPQRFAGAWNFGPAVDEDWPVGCLVERFVHEWGGGSWHGPEQQEPQPHEATYLRLDSSKAASRLGWHSSWDTEKAVSATARWYRGHYDDPAAVLEHTHDDIDAYTEAAKARCTPWARDTEDRT